MFFELLIHRNNLLNAAKCIYVYLCFVIIQNLWLYIQCVCVNFVVFAFNLGISILVVILTNTQPIYTTRQVVPTQKSHACVLFERAYNTNYMKLYDSELCRYKNHICVCVCLLEFSSLNRVLSVIEYFLGYVHFCRNLSFVQVAHRIFGRVNIHIFSILQLSQILCCVTDHINNNIIKYKVELFF